MARPFAITPTLAPGKTTYTAKFLDASGKHVNRSLKTQDLSLARIICQGLVALRQGRFRSESEVPDTIPDEAIRLFFATPASSPPTGQPVDVDRDLDLVPEVAERMEHYPAELQARVLPLLVRIEAQKRIIERQRATLNQVRRELATRNDEYRRLENSILAQTIRSQQNALSIPEALSRFKTHLQATTTHNTCVACTNLATRFAQGLPPDIKTTVEITQQHISSFLDQRASGASKDKALSRRMNDRLRLGRFINWAAEASGYKSQMDGVRKVTTKAVLRERGEIVWHTVDEVEAAIKPLDAYWQALVSTLAYAGLQLAELVWLRRSDVVIDPGGHAGRIFVTAVSDPTNQNARHLLKTGNRQRQIDIEPRHLLPRLEKHLATLAGKHYVFPVPAGFIRRQRKRTIGSDELWVVSTLSKALGGQRRSMDGPRTSGLLPPGMLPRTLRHTFGSLLLRSKKPNGHPYSLSDVAAAMGNTPEMVRQHYARIISSEVVVRLS